MWLERRACRGKRQDRQIVEDLAYLVKDFMLHPRESSHHPRDSCLIGLLLRRKFDYFTVHFAF